MLHYVAVCSPARATSPLLDAPWCGRGGADGGPDTGQGAAGDVRRRDVYEHAPTLGLPAHRWHQNVS